MIQLKLLINYLMNYVKIISLNQMIKLINMI